MTVRQLLDRWLYRRNDEYVVITIWDCVDVEEPYCSVHYRTDLEEEILDMEVQCFDCTGNALDIFLRLKEE